MHKVESRRLSPPVKTAPVFKNASYWMRSSCFVFEKSSCAWSLKPNELSFIPPLRVCSSHKLPYVCFVTQCANPEKELFLGAKASCKYLYQKVQERVLSIIPQGNYSITAAKSDSTETNTFTNGQILYRQLKIQFYLKTAMHVTTMTQIWSITVSS